LYHYSLGILSLFVFKVFDVNIIKSLKSI
jgi:hypothetical protein